MPDKPSGELLKAWRDWSAGIGHALDDGETPGMQYAAGLLGLRGGLRAAPFFNAVVPEMTMATRLDNAVEYAYAAVLLKPADTATPVAYAASGNSKNNGASLTFAFDPDYTANGYLVVCVAASGGADPTGVTFDGTAMTKLVSVTEAGNLVTASVWGLANPTNASKNVIVTHAGAHDVVAGAISFDNVHQTTSTAATATDEDTMGALPDYVKINLTASGVGDMGVDCMAGHSIFAHSSGVKQTERHDAQQGVMRGSGSTQPANTAFQPQYFCEEMATGYADVPYLFIEMDDDGDTGVVLHKVSLRGANFGTSHGEHSLFVAGDKRAGQCARYQGFWFFPAGNNYAPMSLSGIGVGDVSGDTIVVLAIMASGSEHLGNLGHQLVGIVQDGTNAGGVRILKVDGTPGTNADWGAEFQVGDKKERACGVRGLQGATFVNTREGLYSFNDKGRGRLIFEDFRSWTNIFKNIPLNAFKGGLLLLHPSGVQWYVPGNPPVSVGLGSDKEANDISLPEVAELKGGRCHSTSVAGDYIWAVYQPDPSSTEALVVCAYTPTGDPRKLVWQGLGTITLLDKNHMSAIHVAVSGHPKSTGYVTPTVWFADGAGLEYAVLNSRAGPFRTRSDTHKVVTSGEAYMSELVFDEPVDLTELVVTAADMLSDSTDEFQISFITEDGKEENLGGPIRSNGRKTLKIDRHNVHRLVVHVTFTGTSTANRVPPALKAMHLYGIPA